MTCKHPGRQDKVPRTRLAKPQQYIIPQKDKAVNSDFLERFSILKLTNESVYHWAHETNGSHLMKHFIKSVHSQTP